LDILLDMNIPVTVTVGQAEIPVRRLLQLGPGSVLKLDKPIEEPADLYLKDSKFATGNVVIVEGQFAIRIQQILGAGAVAAAAAPAEAVEA
jgi:flagellar motor switch protein FliN/FliY